MLSCTFPLIGCTELMYQCNCIFSVSLGTRFGQIHCHQFVVRINFSVNLYISCVCWSNVWSVHCCQLIVQGLIYLCNFIFPVCLGARFGLYATANWMHQVHITKEMADRGEIRKVFESAARLCNDNNNKWPRFVQ